MLLIDPIANTSQLINVTYSYNEVQQWITILTNLTRLDLDRVYSSSFYDYAYLVENHVSKIFRQKNMDDFRESFKDSYVTSTLKYSWFTYITFFKTSIYFYTFNVNFKKPTTYYNPNEFTTYCKDILDTRRMYLQAKTKVDVNNTNSYSEWYSDYNQDFNSFDENSQVNSHWDDYDGSPLVFDRDSEGHRTSPNPVFPGNINELSGAYSDLRASTRTWKPRLQKRASSYYEDMNFSNESSQTRSDVQLFENINKCLNLQFEPFDSEQTRNVLFNTEIHENFVGVDVDALGPTVNISKLNKALDQLHWKDIFIKALSSDPRVKQIVRENRTKVKQMKYLYSHLESVMVQAQNDKLTQEYTREKIQRWKQLYEGEHNFDPQATEKAIHSINLLDELIDYHNKQLDSLMINLSANTKLLEYTILDIENPLRVNTPDDVLWEEHSNDVDS